MDTQNEIESTLKRLGDLVRETPAAQIEVLKAEIRRMLPIVSAAFWDNHTAGTLPGSGYNNKPQSLASREWGWRDSKKFQSWESQVKELVK